jgi:hypothetical protein
MDCRLSVEMISAELLLNFRLQMRGFRCNCEVSNANKTNENRSVRTGQGELANSGQHLALPMFNWQMQKLLEGWSGGRVEPSGWTPICISKIGELRNAQGPLNFPHIYQISVYKFARLNDLRICTPVCRNSTVKLEVKTAFYKLKKIRRIILVGAPGFEPGTSCAQGRRATRLRYAPIVVTILAHFWEFPEV